ncbi:MAG: YitT family protein [Candidatus Aminicenantes bacterium]|nr:YitT family protein [Candidatus Aminicenantes bacterium]
MKLNKKDLRRNLANLALIVIGSSIMAMGYSLFLIPHHFVPGGVSGLAIMVNYFTRLPVGTLIMVLNIPVFVFGIKIMGRKYGLRSLLGMVISSLLIDFFYEVLKLKSATDNAVLAAIYGGFMLGIGLGLVFRGRASTGGSDIIGQILNKYTGVSIGIGIMLVDFFIISASGLAYKNLEAPLYGYIVLVISTKVIDMILEGWNYTKLVIITSTRTAEIQDFILTTLDRSGTALKSRSLYLNREGETIITVIHRKQLSELREFIKSLDPDAFVIINDTYAVLGKGFKATQVS